MQNANAIDPFFGLPKSLGMPERWEAVTPHATNYLEGDATTHMVAVALYVTTGGVVEYIDMTGTTKTITLPDNFMLPGKFVRVLTANTTAAGIHAGFIGDLPS